MVRGNTMEAQVTLERDGVSHTCSRQRSYSAEMQLRLVAEATAGAIQMGIGEGVAVSIDEVRSFQSGDRTIVVTVIRLGGSRPDELFVGAVIAHYDLWRAAVISTLDALNRRLSLNVV